MNDPPSVTEQHSTAVANKSAMWNDQQYTSNQDTNNIVAHIEHNVIIRLARSFS